MSLHHFKQELVQADICVDNLGQSAIGMTGLDAMATGRPLIANARLEIYAHLIKDPNPVCHAATAEEVCAQLELLVCDREKREQIGRTSRVFVLKHWSPAANAIACLERLGIEYDLMPERAREALDVFN